MDSDCMHVMEELGDMDLLDTDDIWDPSSLFPYETLEEEQQGELLMIQQEKEEGGNGGISTKQQQPCEDLAVVFLEWLKSNKETISAEDLRSIKLKRSTIECAAKRLGGGKEGMKQLLKLILEWVQNHQLQKKRVRETECETTTMAYGYPHQQNNPNPQPCIQNSNLNTNSNPNPNPNFNSIPSPDSNQYFYPSALPQTWIPHPMPSPTFRPVMGYMGEPMFNNGAIPSPFNNNTPNNITNSLENWPQNHFSLSPHYNSFPDQHLQSAPSPQNPFTNFVNQYPCQLYQGAHPDQLVRLGTSATKEARKKRMARQKRLFSHNRSSNNLQLQQSAAMEQHVRVDSMNNCTPNCANHGNWMYWPTSTFGCKSIPEKNLKFLLQKVLKQSDVGNLGRIVLPKKEAETYLPELEARDGISIAMEDIGTSRVWNMRYRFWPNNKSRMYLLENTGDFVRSNGLQEGDFIVIYSDIKCGKYMIRGVKVRQSGSKLETKKQGKTHRNVRVTTTMGIGSSSSMMEQVT
ncbi:hypothetical protein GIB67_024555 [Kingdonia uniflora]|uniref:TF-B3 domain-containing protein n=1 Tax=Kingdonia uniflora TaxID=39325 RepID=A0A7J7LP61_9MAGN|nr:hypothetical protein GIB67_024555 [Kingdonia uniflora]